MQAPQEPRRGLSGLMGCSRASAPYTRAGGDPQDGVCKALPGSSPRELLLKQQGQAFCPSLTVLFNGCAHSPTSIHVVTGMDTSCCQAFCLESASRRSLGKVLLTGQTPFACQQLRRQAGPALLQHADTTARTLTAEHAPCGAARLSDTSVPSCGPGLTACPRKGK